MKFIRREYGAVVLLILAALLAGSLAACGGERKFTADEFVEEVSDEGVELNLGEELTTTESEQLYAIELEPVIGAPKAPGTDRNTRRGGSLAVYADTAGASDRIELCRDAADLLCYQAANIVVILEQGGIEADRLGVAMKRLAE